MPIISTIGRKSLKVRILVWSIYIFLSLGSLTMLYPFMLMIAGSSKSAVDTSDAVLIPAFMQNEQNLYQKHVEGLFNESLQMMQVAYDVDAPGFDAVEMREPNAKLVEVWLAFLNESQLPHYAYTCGYMEAPVTRGVFPLNMRRFKLECMERYNNDISALNHDMGMEFRSWSSFFFNGENYLQRRTMPLTTPFRSTFYAFKERQPYDSRYYFNLASYYKVAFLKTQYTSDIEIYNREHGTSHASWDDVYLDERLPKGPGRTEKERTDWTEFVRTLANLLWVRVDVGATPLYRDFLKAKYGNITALNRLYNTRYADFGDVPLIKEAPHDGVALSDWDAFMQGWKDIDTGLIHMTPAEMIRIHSVDSRFRAYVRTRYENIDSFNHAMGTSYSDWSYVIPPQRDLHNLAFTTQKDALRKEFLTRNYVTVIDYMALHGRSIVNTAIYCILAILGALTVNPLAAYALSRYKPPTAYKMLLFLMLTMAFPPMVTQIPNFLMLRELGMLNTFWALILPGMANGYSIFLLKGFFDSLPHELYESASLDGAGEFRIFWQITMSLSKPILAVIALSAFTAAYSNFMMALLICQNEKMWTLMPWLYQLQQRSGQGVIFASLIIAAIPTFIVFVFCQNIIMRGIVVPVEK